MTTQISAETISLTVHQNTPVITTELLACLYGAEPLRLRNNFSRNKNRFIEGKHYFLVKGEELAKLRVSLRDSQNPIAGNVRALTLWTERGAARHAKMLETDQAWEVFEKLEDHYFNQQKNPPAPPSPKPYATITYFENDLPVNSRLLVPGEIVITPDSCLEHVRRAGYVVVSCDDVGKLTLNELQEMATQTRKAHEHWQKQYQNLKKRSD
ncbi:ORF6N domain-containing protein [Serratia rhizosphaerae]|uniref:ORF6N domain-containing protein n=1 Tax=Serratia rhizosphaerae TaxID=2597702 RepID=A0ABX6GHE0_9GAMM|nr:ORF6N domain-containing protein [Serratia rhizosphaerae]QHA85668.1 ORF6N domain-containing protein [Serratia rhizosphaerae]